MGMEIELQPKLLERLVPLFDWKQVERDMLTNASLQREIGAKTWTGPLGNQPKAFLAEVAIRVANYRDSKSIPSYPPVRKDLPPDVTAMFSELVWHEDQGKMEFSHLKPFEDMGEYLHSLRRFARIAGIDERLNAPNDRRRHELSYHVHLSRADGVSIEKPLAAYNRLNLVRLAKAGNADELFDGQRMSFYSEDLWERGAVRLLDEDHFEVRRHVMPPEQEMVELQLLFSLPGELAGEKIADLTRPLLTPATVAKLVELSPSEALSIVRHVEPQLLSHPGLVKILAEGIFAYFEPPSDLDMLVIRLGELRESGLPNAQAFLSAIRTEAAKEFRDLSPEYRGAKAVHDLGEVLGVPIPLRSAAGVPSEQALSTPPELWRFPPRSIHERPQTVLDRLTGESGPDVLQLIERLPISYLAGPEGFHGFIIAAIKANAMMRLTLLALYERNSASFTREQGVQLHERLCCDQSDHVRLRARQVLPWPSWMRETPSCGPSLSSLSDRAIPAERSPFSSFDRR